MRQTNLTRLAVAALLAVLPSLASAQLLKGKIVGTTIDDAAVGYAPDGNMMNMQTSELQIADDGTFAYDTELEGESGDVEIYVGETGTFGAHLQKGKTVEMTLTRQGDELVATFGKDGRTLNEFVNRMTQAYDMSKYSSMDPAQAKPNAEYRALLEKENETVKALLPTLKDKELRGYYTRLSDAKYRWMKLRLIADDCETNGTDTKDNAEYQALLKDVDVNDDINYQTVISLWAINNMGTATFGGSNEALCDEKMALTDKYVTNPRLRSQLVQIIAQNYYVFGDGSGDYEAFTKRFRDFAGDDAPIVDAMYQQFLATKEAREKTAEGTQAPDITLDAPDGSQVQLKELAKGKFTYIDVWATWCGPCKREIPFMAKLAEKLKGSDKVLLISISVDENVEAWKKMIDADKPDWPQYNIHGETNRQFSEDWGITGIPRFIMINPDGTIFAADATRPSDEKTEQTILEVISDK